MVSVMVYPCMVCFALSMDLFVLCVACLTVFGCGCFRMLWSWLVWLEVLCWIDHVWSSKECVLCL